MATYTAGQKYLRNKDTGAVFQYNERLVGFAKLEQYEADAEGNLVKVANRVPPDQQLSPTKTPEKAGDTGKPVAPKPPTTAKVATTAKPTMAPVSKP